MLQAKAFVEDGDAFGCRLPRWWHLSEAVVARSMVCSGRKPQILPGLDNDSSLRSFTRWGRCHGAIDPRWLLGVSVGACLGCWLVWWWWWSMPVAAVFMDTVSSLEVPPWSSGTYVLQWSPGENLRAGLPARMMVLSLQHSLLGGVILETLSMVSVAAVLWWCCCGQLGADGGLLSLFGRSSCDLGHLVACPRPSHGGRAVWRASGSRWRLGSPLLNDDAIDASPTCLSSRFLVAELPVGVRARC